MNLSLLRWTVGAVTVFSLLGTGCSTNNDTGPRLDASASSFEGGLGPGTCSRPAPGCSCNSPGALSSCSVYEQHSGNYTTCQTGTMACANGVWGSCGSKSVVQKLTLSLGGLGGIHADNLGVATACPSDPCDPSGDAGSDSGTVSGCNQVADTPLGLDAGPDFTITDAGGLTPLQSLTSEAGIACTGISVSPPVLNLTVTALSPVVMTPATANFTAAYVPANCFSGLANAAWSVDKRDLATIADGVLTLVSPVAGPINISAYSAGFQASALVNVTTNVLDTSQVTPAVAAQFTATPTTADNIRWLYPYANTVFPRSIAAPVVQWDNLGTAASAVKVTIQYPATGTAVYTVATILPESTPPQAALAQDAWAYLDQTAAGNDALITIQRLVGGVLRKPVTETIHFAKTALRGNIFYTEYDNTANTAAIKSAKPFGTAPSIVALPGSGCNPCHSVSANGTTLVTSNWGSNGISVDRVNGDGTMTAIAAMGNQPSPPAQDSRGFAYSAVSPDGTISLQGTNLWGNTWAPGSANTGVASAPHGNGSGLTGAYYANTTQAGAPAFTVTDSTIDFTWGAASPGGSIAAGSSYSVSWTGYVQAIFSETYTFETESSDGVRLTVGGNVAIDHLGAQADTKYTGTLAMTAGAKVPITLVYENVTNTSQVHLRWSSASQPYEVVQVTQLYPSAAATTTGLYGQYFNNVFVGTSFDPTASAPTATRNDSTVNFNWNGAAPIAGVSGSFFGASWAGQVTIPCNGNYQFCVTGDDGVRLWIDGTLTNATGWRSQGATQYCGGTSALTAGTQHAVRFDYFQGTGGAVAQLQWNTSCAGSGIIPTGDLTPSVSPPPTTNGLSATYYGNIDFTGTATSEIDPTVDFAWNGSSPASNIPGDNFSASWTGQVQIPCTDNYQFCVTGDDGVRLWLDGTLVDDGWKSQGATQYCGGLVAETAGSLHDIKMDYFQGAGGAVAQLQWVAGCVGGSQTIPQADLFPTGDQGTGGLDIPFHNAGDYGTGVGYSIFTLPGAVGGSPIDVTGANSWGLGKTAMMVPTFSPDGKKLIFVDGDTSGGSAWRQGLSFFNFDQAGQAFSGRTNFVNMKPAGNIIRWPAVESDSRSVIFQTNPTSQDDSGYGGMGPSGYSSIQGQLWSVDMSTPSTPVSLNAVNAGLGGVDANQSYQATVLPAPAGGYRWTVFTSDRQYGNTQNVIGSGLEATTQLWVGALDDAVSAATDRSHPPFWFPNQVLGTNGGRIRNERAYWVLDACRPSLANLNPPMGTKPATFIWTDQDIGNVAHMGSASASGGTITVTGGGDDIWNTADAFHYAYMPISGDFQFVARILSATPSDYWAKAGIMLRDNLASNSAFAHMMINAGAYLGFQWRLQNGAQCDWAQWDTEAFPWWVRLTRKGTVVTGEVSQDGLTWNLVGTQTPTIGNNAYIGLAVNAHNNSTTSTAVFDNVGFVGTTAADPRPASVCKDDQDCCDAQTTPPTAACQVDVPVSSPVTRHCISITGNSCIALGSTCVSDADCCGFPTNDCNMKGVCAIPPPQFPYTDTVFTRDYVASCPMGMQPVWRYFDWTDITPADSDIKFSVATAAMASLLPATIGGATVVPLAKAPGAPINMAGMYYALVSDALHAAGQSENLNYLRVYADFQPTSDGAQAPTLNTWQQQYDCIAAE